MNFNDIQEKREKNEALGLTLFLERELFFKTSFIYFWLLWVLLAACGLSLAVMSRGYSSCSVRASHCGDFSCCRAQALEHSGFSSCSMQVQ